MDASRPRSRNCKHTAGFFTSALLWRRLEPQHDEKKIRRTILPRLFSFSELANSHTPGSSLELYFPIWRFRAVTTLSDGWTVAGSQTVTQICHTCHTSPPRHFLSEERRLLH
jgi:hypothetical protein